MFGHSYMSPNSPYGRKYKDTNDNGDSILVEGISFYKEVDQRIFFFTEKLEEVKVCKQEIKSSSIPPRNLKGGKLQYLIPPLFS